MRRAGGGQFCADQADGERNALREHDGVPDKRAAAYGRHRKDRKRLDDDTAADRDHAGFYGLFGGIEISRIDQVDRHEQERKREHRQRAGCHRNQRGIAVEQPHCRYAEHDQQHIDHDCADHIDLHTRGEVSTQFPAIFLAECLSPKRLQALRHTGQDRVGQGIDKTENAERRYPHITQRVHQYPVIAECGHRRIELGDALRHAALADLTDQRRRIFKPSDAQIAFFPDKIADQEQKGQQLAQAGGDCCALDPHPERENEQPIQKDICRRAGTHTPERQARRAVIAHKNRQAVAQQKRNGKGGVVKEVLDRQRQDRFAAAAKLCDLPRKERADEEQDDQQQQRHNKRAHERIVCALFVPASQPDRNDRRTAHRKQR